LNQGQVTLSDLVITKHISQDPQTYKKATLSAVVAQELVSRGIKLDPGESIQYIITNDKDKDPASRARAYSMISSNYSYDVEKYTELLLKSGETLFSIFGYGLKKLEMLTDLRRKI
jgi:DNA polymerase II